MALSNTRDNINENLAMSYYALHQHPSFDPAAAYYAAQTEGVLIIEKTIYTPKY